MGMDIDETRRGYPAFRIDDFARGAGRFTYRDEATGTNANVTAPQRRASAVGDVSINDFQIVRD